MAKFMAYTADDATVTLETKLEAAKSSFGFVPTLRATTAESPELLAGYSAVWDLLSIQKAA
jgi:hypothetical protein